jgi:di/tricarboxylate transporter
MWGSNPRPPACKAGALPTELMPLETSEASLHTHFISYERLVRLYYIYMRFLVGLVGIPLGFVIIVYRERIKQFTGDISWAEKHLGSGGSYTAILLFGLLVTFGSFLFMTGTLQLFFESVFGNFF